MTLAIRLDRTEDHPIQEIGQTLWPQAMSRHPLRQPHRGENFAATAERHFRRKHYG